MKQFELQTSVSTKTVTMAEIEDHIKVVKNDKLRTSLMYIIYDANVGEMYTGVTMNLKRIQ